MSGIILRILLYIIIFALIYFGVKRIILDWKEKFNHIDKQARERDKEMRKRDDVVELKKDKDGIFRPKKPDED